MSTTTVSDSAHCMRKKHTKLSSSRFGVGLQQFVYDSVKIHQASIFPQVVLWFSKEDVRLAIATFDANFPRLCQRAHDLDFVVETYQELGPESGNAKREPTNVEMWEHRSGKADE